MLTVPVDWTILLSVEPLCRKGRYTLLGIVDLPPSSDPI